MKKQILVAMVAILLSGIASASELTGLLINDVPANGEAKVFTLPISEMVDKSGSLTAKGKRAIITAQQVADKNGGMELLLPENIKDETFVSIMTLTPHARLVIVDGGLVQIRILPKSFDDGSAREVSLGDSHSQVQTIKATN